MAIVRRNLSRGILRNKAITIAVLTLFCIFSIVSWLDAFRYLGVSHSQPDFFDPNVSSDLITVFAVTLCVLIFLVVLFESPLRLDRLVFALTSVPMVLFLIRAFMRPFMEQSLVIQVAEALCWTFAAGLCVTALFSTNRGNQPDGAVQHTPIESERSPQPGNWKISVEPMLVGVGVGIGFGVFAYVFLMYRHQGMGATLFLLVPVAAGFSIGIMTGRKSEALATALALTSPLLLLVLMGKEGVLCALLAFPILSAAIGIGL